MSKEHKHKWYETSLAKDTKTSKSFACKCGCWKMENSAQNEKWSILKYFIKKANKQ